jgi:hypothetical protein
MTDYTVAAALAQLRTVLLATAVAGQPALAAGYVMPDQFDLLPDTLPLPCVAVSELYNAPAEWLRLGTGLGIHVWRAEVLLFVAPGPLTTLNRAAAQAMLKTREWARAMVNALWVNQTLNGQALQIGEPLDKMRPTIRYTIGHVFLDPAQQYWGARLELPIQQRYGPCEV